MLLKFEALSVQKRIQTQTHNFFINLYIIIIIILISPPLTRLHSNDPNVGSRPFTLTLTTIF